MTPDRVTVSRSVASHAARRSGVQGTSAPRATTSAMHASTRPRHGVGERETTTVSPSHETPDTGAAPEAANQLQTDVLLECMPYDVTAAYVKDILTSACAYQYLYARQDDPGSRTVPIPRDLPSEYRPLARAPHGVPPRESYSPIVGPGSKLVPSAPTVS